VPAKKAPDFHEPTTQVADAVWIMVDCAGRRIAVLVLTYNSIRRISTAAFLIQSAMGSRDTGLVAIHECIACP
jgi:hypothetical protein